MNVLIAISSKHHSEPTLKAGMKVANAFSASSTVLEVGEKINEFSMKEVYMARERIESWNFDRPGVDVLEWAFNFLCKEKLINDLTEQGDPRVLGKGDIFDQYPYSGEKVKNFYTRFMNGEEIPTHWVNRTDFEK